MRKKRENLRGRVARAHMGRARGKNKVTVSVSAKSEETISKKPADMAMVRENIKNMVINSAETIVVMLIKAARNGELAPARYLFEAAGLHPAVEGSNPPEEDSLAYSLLKQLGLPTEPVGVDSVVGI